MNARAEPAAVPIMIGASSTTTLMTAINCEAYNLISRGIISAKDLDATVTSGPGLR